MPVEIHELQVITTVQENSSTSSSGGASVNTDNIVAKCVEQVLEILKEKNER